MNFYVLVIRVMLFMLMCFLISRSCSYNNLLNRGFCTLQKFLCTCYKPLRLITRTSTHTFSCRWEGRAEEGMSFSACQEWPPIYLFAPLYLCIFKTMYVYNFSKAQSVLHFKKVNLTLVYVGSCNCSTPFSFSQAPLSFLTLINYPLFLWPF